MKKKIEPKPKIKKTEKLNFRIAPETLSKLHELAERYQSTQTEVFETAIGLLHARMKGK